MIGAGGMPGAGADAAGSSDDAPPSGAQPKLSRLLQIEQDFAAKDDLGIISEIHDSNQKILLISCHTLNADHSLNTDHVIVKIDTIIRSYKIRNPNTTIKAPLMIKTSNSEAFLQRLNKLGVCREVKENIVFYDEISKFSKFASLFCDCCFQNMLERKQIGFNFKTLYMLKMQLRRPYPSCLDRFKSDIIIGAYIAFPEFVFGVTNVWINENESFGVYKMKNSDQLLIHSQSQVVLENLFYLGYIESMESLVSIQGSSLLGSRVSFRGSKSDKLYILPCISLMNNLIMASVPSQVELDYKSWLNIGTREDWKSYVDQCAPTPFLNNSNPTIGYFPALYKGPKHLFNRSDASFVNIEEVWDILHNNKLPEKRPKDRNTSPGEVTVLLDETFDSNVLRRFLQLKLRFPLNQNVLSLRGKIVDWLFNHNLVLPVTEDRTTTQLVIRNESITDSSETAIFYPVINDEQISNLFLKQEYLTKLKNSLSAFLILLFNYLEKNGIDYERDHPFRDYLDANQTIWKDYDKNLIHYQLVGSTKILSELSYQSMFPKLKPSMIISNQYMLLDGMRMEIQNMDDLKRQLIDLYSATAYRMTIVHGMFDDPSFDRTVANSYILSLNNYLEILESHSKTEVIEEEELDELDYLFIALSSKHLLKSYSYYAEFNIRYAFNDGWYTAQMVFKEYVQRKNFIKRKPNTLLINNFLKNQLRILHPIIPAFASYCWTDILGIKDSILCYENIPLPDPKYLLSNHLIRAVLPKSKLRKRKYSTARITVCDKKEEWHVKALAALKAHEEYINSQDCLNKLFLYVKDYLKEKDIKTIMRYMSALCELYKELGSDIFMNGMNMNCSSHILNGLVNNSN
ncbi:leucyl-tRNA synthetase [Naegleria gruberi]|uniref:Leucyl-tRNA synthetase n=1 Tax=Naegleria gruberi TaxID=5762 RepID=D2VW33_NAEGR|nr:leucyl-tRNA synthetase [Naegleria gruberi]EFC38944.1 leucyl-tRNA synthetase [Naegleria gruberi]|eukprot:XP_002671688.1 leucyl-tRNA synthetase [Naegleria gruberi strain NEG-M]